MKTTKFAFEKVDAINKEILQDEFFNYALQVKIELFKDYLHTGDIDSSQLKAWLQIVIQLMKRKLSLRRSMRQLFTIHRCSYRVMPRVISGDEWKIETGYVKSITKELAYVEEKCFVDGYRLDLADNEIVDINKKLKYLLEKIDTHYPADYLILEVNVEHHTLENRTN